MGVASRCDHKRGSGAGIIGLGGGGHTMGQPNRCGAVGISRQGIFVHMCRLQSAKVWITGRDACAAAVQTWGMPHCNP